MRKNFIKNTALLVSKLLFGNKFHDQASDHGLKNVLKEFTVCPVGQNNAPNRDTWIKQKLSNLPPGSKILDAGAGELRYKDWCSHLKYTSQDFGQYDGTRNREGLQMGTWDTSKVDILSDITSIPVPDNSFDAIICIEVFEHIPEPAKAAKEFSRILKPGGKLILTVPFCSLTHFAPYYFANGYSKYWYEKILPEYGFEIKEMEFNGNFFEYLAQEFRRIPEMEKRYSKQRRIATGIFYKLIKAYLLIKLYKLSKRTKGSEEFLCFGLHVLAEKKH